MQISPAKLKVIVDTTIASNPNIKMRDISDAAGWTERRLYQLMEGKSTNINPRIGEAIARKLKCKVAEITV